MTGEPYICAVCGGSFVRVTPDDELIEEMHDLHGPLYPGENAAIVCENCYVEFRKWLDSLSPDQRAAIERERKGKGHLQ